MSQRVVGLGFFPHGWARYAPKAGALPTAQHPDMKLWDCPGVSSQSKRATNCATPGYEIFQLWSNMWSTPFFDQLPSRGKVLSAQLPQGFPGFPRTEARTWASRSQIKRATNCAIPGYLILNHYNTNLVRLKYFSVCGHSCGQSRLFSGFGAHSKSRFRPCSKGFRAYVRAANG